MSDLFVIDDSTPISALQPAVRDKGRGLELPEGFARSYEGVAEPFPKELYIPRSEWQARIQERKDLKATFRDLAARRGIKVKNQQSTSYCWINAPTFCVELIRAKQNQPHVVLSPASAGAQIKRYRNVGGWGREGLEWIVEHGLAPVDLWPANAIDRRYATESTIAEARKYRVDEWWVLPERDIDALASCVLRGHPVAVGYNWWSHEVSAVDMDWIDGEIALIIGNSWSENWGTNGYGVIQGRRMLPDDCVAPRSALAA